MTIATPSSGTRELLLLPEFRALLAARGLAALAMTAIATVVGFQTYELTGDPLALGIVGLVEAIPALALMLFGGHVADRRDRRTIVIITGILLTIGALVLALLSLQADVSFASLLAVVFLVGVAAGFERPALMAFETQVIPFEHASRGVSLTGSAWTAAAILGPAVGGLTIAVIGIPATYLALAVILAISVLCVARISRKPMPVRTEGESVVTSLVSGVRYVAGSSVLLGSMALDLFAIFFGGAMALMPAFAADVLHVGPVGLGLLRTAPSIGALLSMLATTRLPPRRRAGRILLVSVAIFGLAMIVFGLSTSFLLSLVALFVAGLADGISVVIRLVILRVESPEAMRGRIASVNHVFIGASNELGAFESGVAATVMGVVPSVVAGGFVTLGVAGAVAAFVPALRRLDLGRRLIEGPGMQSYPGGTSLDPSADLVLEGVGALEITLPGETPEDRLDPGAAGT